METPCFSKLEDREEYEGKEAIKQVLMSIPYLKKHNYLTAREIVIIKSRLLVFNSRKIIYSSYNSQP